MLLQSTTKINFTLTLSLTFDDNTQKEVELTGNRQYALIEFIRNGNRYRRAGSILNVRPEFNIDGNMCNHLVGTTFDTAVILFDCGTLFESCRLHIKTTEIRNIRLVSRKYVEELLSTGTEITPEMFDEPDVHPFEMPEDYTESIEGSVVTISMANSVGKKVTLGEELDIVSYYLRPDMITATTTTGDDDTDSEDLISSGDYTDARVCIDLIVPHKSEDDTVVDDENNNPSDTPVEDDTLIGDDNSDSETEDPVVTPDEDVTVDDPVEDDVSDTTDTEEDIPSVDESTEEDTSEPIV